MRLENMLLTGVLAGTLYAGKKVYDVNQYNDATTRAYRTCTEFNDSLYCAAQRPPYKSDQTYLLAALFGAAILAGSAVNRMGYGPR